MARALHYFSQYAESITEAEWFKWKCATCQKIPRGAGDLEIQWINEWGIYTDKDDSKTKWVRCKTCKRTWHLVCQDKSEAEIRRNPEFVCFSCFKPPAAPTPSTAPKQIKIPEDPIPTGSVMQPVDIPPYQGLKRHFRKFVTESAESFYSSRAVAKERLHRHFRNFHQ